MPDGLSRYVTAEEAGAPWWRQLRSMARASVRTPWKARHELRRMAGLPATRLYFLAHGVAWGTGWHVYGLPVIQRTRGSEIRIGNGLEMRNWFASNPLGVRQPCLLATWTPDARIRIGDAVGITGSTICAQAAVDIGSDVLIGANTLIVDTDFHGLAPGDRHRPGAAVPIVIEDGVFIGTRATILKGAHIGRGSVVGAGSVVTGHIPAGVIVAGNPARIVREVPDADGLVPGVAG